MSAFDDIKFSFRSLWWCGRSFCPSVQSRRTYRWRHKLTFFTLPLSNNNNTDYTSVESFWDTKERERTNTKTRPWLSWKTSRTSLRLRFIWAKSYATCTRRTRRSKGRCTEPCGVRWRERTARPGLWERSSSITCRRRLLAVRLGACYTRRIFRLIRRMIYS